MMKRRREKEQVQNIMHGNQTCFYKLFLSPTSQSLKLRIPHTFASTFRNELSSGCILKLPTGEIRKVGLAENDNKLYFHDGWQEFVEYCSIQYAYFLLFTYVGKSNFIVDIFDCTGCEISYPCNVQNTPESQQKSWPAQIHYDNDDNDDDYNESSKVIHSSPVNMKSSGEEIIELDSDDSSETMNSISVSENDFYSEETQLDMDEKEINDAKEGTSFKRPSNLENHKGLMDAVVAAGISLPKQPFFVTLIKPYVLNKGLYLNIPLSFAHEHLVCKGVKNTDVKLEAYSGKLFTVQCSSRLHKCSFGKGWIIFAREVGLEVGDACVFELTDAKNSVLKAHIVKRSQLNAAAPHLF